MFRLFKKNKKDINPRPGLEKTAAFIVNVILWLQCEWTKCLSEKEKKMTTKQKKLALVILGLSMVVISVFFISHAVLDDKHYTSRWLKPPSATFPQDSRLPDSINLKYLRELYKQHKNRINDSINP